MRGQAQRKPNCSTRCRRALPCRASGPSATHGALFALTRVESMWEPCDASKPLKKGLKAFKEALRTHWAWLGHGTREAHSLELPSKCVS